MYASFMGQMHHMSMEGINEMLLMSDLMSWFDQRSKVHMVRIENRSKIVPFASVKTNDSMLKGKDNLFKLKKNVNTLDNDIYLERVWWDLHFILEGIKELIVENGFFERVYL